MEIEAEAQSNAIREIAEAQIDAHQNLQAAGLGIEADVDFAERVEQSVRFRALKRQANIETIVNAAAAELDDAEVPDEEPDHDWTARFFEYIQDVSTDEMQSLWAKVLAGEIERQGTTSLHTLGILRDLDHNTAQLFEKMCSLSLFYVVNESIVHDARVVLLRDYSDGNELAEYGLPYNALNRLQEHGLITPAYNSYMEYGPFVNVLNGLAKSNQGVNIEVLAHAVRHAMAIEYADQAWYLKSLKEDTADAQLRITGVQLSNAGKELSRVVTLSPDASYSTALASFLRSRHLELVRFEDNAALH